MFDELVNSELAGLNISPSSTRETIMINDTKSKARHFEENTFTDIYLNYVNHKLKDFKNKSLIPPILTDPKNQFQACNALNTIYLDGDYYLNEQENLEIKNKDIAVTFMKFWIKELNAFSVKYYYFIFIPSIFNSSTAEKTLKSGFHIMIFLDKLLATSELIKIYENIKKENDLFHLLILTGDNNPLSLTNYETIFDIGTIKTRQCLLPFAQKSPTSRRYKLYFTNYKVETTYFVLPSFHFVVDDKSDLINFSSNPEEVQELLKNVEDEIINQQDYDEHRILGKIPVFILKFIKNLRFLRKTHIFWIKFSEHDYRFKLYMLTLRMMLVTYYSTGKQTSLPDKDILIKIVAKVWNDLIQLLPDNKTDTNRKDIKSTILNVKSAYKYAFYILDGDVPTFFSKLIYNPEELGKKEVLTLRKYLKIVNLSLNKDELEGSDGSTQNESGAEEVNTKSELKNKNLARIKSLRLLGVSWFKNILAEWTKFISTITEHLTLEIQPFILKDDDTIIYTSFTDIINTEYIPDMEGKFNCYNKFVKNMIIMFLLVNFYETCSLIDGITQAILPFVRYFLREIRTEGGEGKLYIYNIRQTRSLCSLPFNQWTEDSPEGHKMVKKITGSETRGWLKKLYQTNIGENLKMSKSIKLIEPFFNKLKVINNYLVRKSIMPSSITFDTLIDKLFDNILQSIPRNKNIEILKETSSEWTACFNGYYRIINSNGFKAMNYSVNNFQDKDMIIEAINHMSIEFSVENYERHMDSTMNIIYDPHYDYNCSSFNKIVATFEQILPDDKIRLYVCRILAQVLYGHGSRDLYTILYGSGADGKTTLCNLIGSMLGSTNLNDAFLYLPFRVKLKNNRGMAAQIKTDTITTKDSGTQSHDSGGLINLRGKRFVTIAEPNPKHMRIERNCAILKQLTGQTAIVAREIFKSSECFIPNLVIIEQTNNFLGYSEDNVAIRRRVSLIKMPSKFYSKINEEEFSTLQYKYPQDPNLLLLVNSDINLWTATFYYLLPFAFLNLYQNNLITSDIPRPEEITNSTIASFEITNPLAMWLNQNLVTNKNSCVNIYSILEKIYSIDALSDKSNKLLQGKNGNERRMNLFHQLVSLYMGKIYCVKPEFIKKTVLAEKMLIMDYKTIETDKDYKKYFNSHSLSDVVGSQNMIHCLFIFDYQFSDGESN
jgi:hypothetical protein